MGGAEAQAASDAGAAAVAVTAAAATTECRHPVQGKTPHTRTRKRAELLVGEGDVELAEQVHKGGTVEPLLLVQLQAQPAREKG